MLINFKGGRADVPLFETIKTNAGTQPKNEFQQCGLAVAFMMFIKELRRNGG